MKDGFRHRALHDRYSARITEDLLDIMVTVCWWFIDDRDVEITVDRANAVAARIADPRSAHYRVLTKQNLPGLRPERIHPAHARKPAEVDIGRAQFGAVFNGQRRQMGIAG